MYVADPPTVKLPLMYTASGNTALFGKLNVYSVAPAAEEVFVAVI